MYTTCIYCHKPLGANEIIERFPVGRRLAFDASRGRLWVVCRACERWNLSPLETRWEAIEECERAFLATQLRISTDNIGLARLGEGLELVRIGSPERPEFAAWRYGDQFGRRRRRSFLIAGGAVAAIGAVVAGAAATGIGIGGFAGILGNIPNMMLGMRSVKLKTDDGRLLKVKGTEFPKISLLAAPHGGPRLQFKHKGRLEVFDDDEALRLAGRLLPAINAAGGSKRTVADAVGQLEAERGSEAFIERFVASRVRSPRVAALARVPPLAKLDGPTRLALEMALHEESERRAIEGELDVLLEAWREAEEIAGISDDLLITPEVERQLGDLKRKADR
jgi:hypothetical protein